MDLSEQKNLKVDHEPAKLDEASRMLLKAAALIEERGLAKDQLEDARGQVCINGAINLVLTGSAEWPKDFNVYVKCPAVRKLMDSMDGRCPSIFNNDPKTTKEMVVARLLAVALSG